MISFLRSKTKPKAEAEAATQAPPVATPAAHDNTLLEAVLRSGVILPSPSTALLQLQQAANDPDSGPRDISAIVERDPGLVGAVLRVVNSPVFRARTPATTAFEAIARLGRTKTMAIASSEALRAHSMGLAPRLVERLWGAAARCADHCYSLACHSRLRSAADQAYLAAMLHDVGVLLQLQRFPEHADALLAADDLEAAQRWLDEQTGLPHAALGGMILRNWHLPTPIVDAVANHHSPEACTHPLTAQLGCLIASAHWPEPDDTAWQAWSALAEPLLGLDAATLATLRQARADDTMDS